MTRSLFWTLAPGSLAVVAFVLITTALFGQHSRWLDGIYFLEVSCLCDYPSGKVNDGD